MHEGSVHDRRHPTTGSCSTSGKRLILTGVALHYGAHNGTHTSFCRAKWIHWLAAHHAALAACNFLRQSLQAPCLKCRLLAALGSHTACQQLQRCRHTDSDRVYGIGFGAPYPQKPTRPRPHNMLHWASKFEATPPTWNDTCMLNLHSSASKWTLRETPASEVAWWPHERGERPASFDGPRQWQATTVTPPGLRQQRLHKKQREARPLTQVWMLAGTAKLNQAEPSQANLAANISPAKPVCHTSTV